MKYLNLISSVLLLALLLISPAPLQAQEISIEAHSVWSPTSLENYIESGSTVSYLTFGRFEWGFKTAKYDISYRRLFRQALKSGPRFGLNANAKFDLFNRVSVKTGLGITYQEYRLEQNLLDSDALLLSVDTIIGDVVNVVENQLCNEYTNMAPRLGAEARAQKYQVFSVNIPLLIQYELMERWNIAAGFRASAPIVANRNVSEVGIERDFSTDQVVCTYFVEETDVDDLQHFNDLQLSSVVQLTYQIRAFDISLLIEKQLNNTFTTENGPEVPHTGFSYQPIAVGFSLGRRF